MAEGTEKTHSTPAPWVLVLVALLGGSGSNLGWNIVKDPRPDPFTGTQGKELSKRIDKIENWIDIHTKFGYEKTIEWNKEMSDLTHRCSETQALVTRLLKERK